MIQPKTLVFGGAFTGALKNKLIGIGTDDRFCTPIFFLAQQESNVEELIRQHRPDIIISVGDIAQYPHLQALPPQEEIRWLNYASVEDLIAERALLINIFTNAVIEIRDNIKTEKVSAFTTSYNSRDYILRPLNSLLAQSHKDWEWVIYDDSDGDENWENLKRVQSHDPSRIRIFRGNGNSGNIGNVKQIASQLCRGDFILELDHDDILEKDAFKNLVAAARAYPEAGFFYSDYCFMHENGDNDEHPDGFALGFGGYRRQWNDDFGENGKWTNISRTVPVTDITTRYLVGSPNHYRCWRATTFREMGGWCPEFNVADDYEIIVRSFLHTTMVRVATKSYTQFVNTPTKESGDTHNNFTFIRNAEIQKIWRSLARRYNDRIHKRLMQLQGSDPCYQTWETTAPELGLAYHEHAAHQVKHNKVFNPLDQDPEEPHVFVVFCYDHTSSLDNGGGKAIIEACHAMYRQSYKNLQLFVVTSGCADIVEPIMDNLAHSADPQFREFVRKNVAYWNFQNKYEYFMCLNHATKRINTSGLICLLEHEPLFASLDVHFIENCVLNMVQSIHIKAIQNDNGVPHLMYRAQLHLQHGYADRNHFDTASIFKSKNVYIDNYSSLAFRRLVEPVDATGDENIETTQQ